MRVYEAVMVDEITEPAYPIKVEKVIGFLVFKLRQGRTVETLHN